MPQARLLHKKAQEAGTSKVMNNKIGKVMGEFKRGTLKSGSGAKVKNRRQALAIAMSEAGMSKKKK
jgi:hypothetical protein